MENKLKENAALPGSCSKGVDPCLESLNGEAANGQSLTQTAATGKIEETIMRMLSDYRMNAFAQCLRQQLNDPAWSFQPFLRRLLTCLEAEQLVRKERGAERRFKSAGLPRGTYSLKQFDFAPGRGITQPALEEIVECRWIAKREPHQRRDSRRNGKSIAITGATGCGKSFLAMVISSETIERGFNVKYWSLGELVEKLSGAEKKSEALRKINAGEVEWPGARNCHVILAKDIYEEDMDNLCRFVNMKKEILERRNPGKTEKNKLTGLFARIPFFTQTETFLRINEAAAGKYCLVAIDIEHFKLFNEWYGQVAGDKLLREIGAHLNKMRQEFGGIAGYMGGDDFVIVLPNDEKVLENLKCRITGFVRAYGGHTGFLPAFGFYMKTGTIFGCLTEYKKAAYYQEHPYIEFDTLYGDAKYEVFAAFAIDVVQDTSFVYNQYVDMDEDTYNDYVAEVIRRSDVDSGIRPEYGEQLLTLSTCEYSSANGRYVVVARKVSS